MRRGGVRRVGGSCFGEGGSGGGGKGFPTALGRIDVVLGLGDGSSGEKGGDVLGGEDELELRRGWLERKVMR